MALDDLGPRIGRFADSMSNAEEVIRGASWSARWPFDDEEATVFLGQIDLAWRDDRGCWHLAQWADAGAPIAPERLRLLLSTRFLAAHHGANVAEAWQVRLGTGGGMVRVDAFEDRAIDEAARVVLAPGGGR